MPRLLHLITVALLLSLLAPAQSARAQGGEPSREPVLRIETGMHTAVIRRIGVDAANRYLVTASEDKTVRVWELPAGRLLRVIRAPLGAGNEGKLFAVALSPDGTTIAAGGWTVGGESGENIYLFDRESGRLLRRLGGLPNVVNHLVYSPDGRYLAATLGGTNGVRVYQTRDYSPAGEDRDYGGQSYGADFDRAGRLVTTCYDGFIRLYAPVGENSLRLVAKQKATGGDRPFSASFSPDGSRVGIGFADSTRVAVLSGRDLSPLYAPDTSGVNNGDLSKVAWSADGSTLYAGGRAQDANNRFFIRAWADGGRGAYRDIAGVAADTIYHILPLRDGGIVYGAGEPAFGALNAGGRRVLFTSAAIADYRNNQQGFLLSPDGAGLGFAYELFGNSPARFSLADRKLDAAPAAGSVRWRPPTTEAAGLRVTDWFNTYEPKLNGARLKLKQYEVSFSLAVAPDASGFLLGTNFSIRLFDRNGAERWNVPVPGVAWAVNIPADGRLAVAAYADGTIRWYSMKDGRELLAFFPHADRKRWVVWTPSGYYDAAPGAEDLIGWHVNNGRDRAADFFPAGQFRDAFYRPDVVSKILETGDEARAVQLANEEAGRKTQQANVAQMLPPVVEIISPADGAEVAATEIVVRFNVRTPSGEPVTEIRALVGGRPVATERGLGLQAAGQTSTAARELRINVPEGESQVSVIAANRFTTSVPATVRVRARAPAVATNTAAPANRPASAAAAASDQFEIRPKLYVLAVGVSNYADPKLKLNFAAKDARDFAAAWERQKGPLYRDVTVRLLPDDKATKDEVLDGLDWIRKETTSKDVAVILLAGHGVNDPTGSYYFLPHNADVERLLRTGVSFNDIKQTVATIAGKVLFFVDTCHSGNILGGARRGLLDDLNGVVNELASAENGAVVFAASTGRQYSLEKAEWNNGAFTLAVVEGVDGRADYDKTGKGKITINMLDLYISERVKELTRGQQTPTTAKPNTVPDFPVALKR
ncbi:MAG: caspase family protein [Pyrinomonadaceae bacterium]